MGPRKAPACEGQVELGEPVIKAENHHQKGWKKPGECRPEAEGEEQFK